MARGIAPAPSQVRLRLSDEWLVNQSNLQQCHVHRRVCLAHALSTNLAIRRRHKSLRPIFNPGCQEGFSAFPALEWPCSEHGAAMGH